MLAQAQSFKNIVSRVNLVDRVAGQRNADSIADALGQQRTNAHGGFNNAAVDGASFSNARMQRIIALSRHQPVSCQSQRHIVSFKGNFNIAVIHIL